MANVTPIPLFGQGSNFDPDNEVQNFFRRVGGLVVRGAANTAKPILDAESPLAIVSPDEPAGGQKADGTSGPSGQTKRPQRFDKRDP